MSMHGLAKEKLIIPAPVLNGFGNDLNNIIQVSVQWVSMLAKFWHYVWHHTMVDLLIA